MKKLAIVAVLIAVVIFGIVAYASALTTVVDNVTVTATANPKLEMTLSTNAVAFGAVDPGAAAAPQVVTITVKSNKTYTLGKVVSGQDATMGLTTVLTPNALTKTAGRAHIDTYSLTMPWTTDPGAYSANVEYTAAQ